MTQHTVKKVWYQHTNSFGSKLREGYSNLRVDGKSESAVIAKLKKRHPKSTDIIILSIEW